MPLYEECIKRVNGSVDMQVAKSLEQLKAELGKLKPNTGFLPAPICIRSEEMCEAYMDAWCAQIKQHLVTVEHWPPNLVHCRKRLDCPRAVLTVEFQLD